MPTLFISYKRGTAAVEPLKKALSAAYYRLWFDRDQIHLGDASWKTRIGQGLALSGQLVRMWWIIPETKIEPTLAKIASSKV